MLSAIALGHASVSHNAVIMGLTLLATQPQIKQKCDRDGQSYWQIYDPASGHFTLLGSETEVRIWLENYFS